ncbi:ATP-binding protein [Chloroflexota bacterium]
MGHIVSSDNHYHLLQQRLDRNVTCAPSSPTLISILKLIFSVEEAEIAQRIPAQPTSLEVISSKLAIPSDELYDKLTDMAQRGLVVDLEYGERHYFFLAPVVIGFFEFTFMRTRDDLPMVELARLFEEYMYGEDGYELSLHQGQTQVGRRLVREEALPEDDHFEILDWERASQIILSASTIGVSLCPCRHKAGHLGESCESPLDVCLSLNHAAEALIPHDIARLITTKEAMKILESCKEAGLAQTADNVQRKVTYICNCCSCCCGMVKAMKTYDLRNAIVSSNWIMEIDLSACNGCGKCVDICPTDAIEIVEEKQGKKKKRWAIRDESLCLGCGVCYSTCKFGGITMKPREQRIFTPESVFDKEVMMAIERGKLANLIFPEPWRFSHRALGRIVNILEKSPPFKAAMAIKPLHSVFLNTMVKEAKKQLGEITKVIS